MTVQAPFEIDNASVAIHSVTVNVSAANKSDNASLAAAQPAWAGFLLNQAAFQIRAMTVSALEPFAITPPQLRALEVIEAERSLSQTRLGELVNMDRTTIVHVIDRFEALGVASRNVDPADRRSHAVTLTTKGKNVLASARNCAREVERDFLSPLSQPQQQALIDALKMLTTPTR